MKDFKKFLEELDVTGLSGIPGQGGKRPGERDYLADVEARAKQRLDIAGAREGDPRAIQRAIGTLMQSSEELKRLSRGHERELEELAQRVIYESYKEIIDYFKIRLDLKIVTPAELGRESRQETSLKDPSKAKKYDPVKDKDKKPVVKARAVDFSLLLHEAVKGIYIVLYRQAIPVDPKVAKELKNKFGLSDEPAEWRYGPEIAADLRDFINESKYIDKYPNLREFLFYEMCHKLGAEEFVDLMRGILSKTTEARTKVDAMLKSLAERFEAWARYKQELEEYNRQLEEYNKELAEWEKSGGKEVAEVEEPIETESGEVDYDTWSKKDFEKAIDAALDANDFDLLKKLSIEKQKKYPD